MLTSFHYRVNASPFTEMKSVDGNNNGGQVLGEDNISVLGGRHQWNYTVGSKIC